MYIERRLDVKRNIIYKTSIIIVLPLILFLTTLELISLDIDYFEKKYKEYNIEDSTGIIEKDLKQITQEMIKYLKDQRDDLNITKKVNGIQREIFNQREKQHMVDVKELFIKGRVIRNTLLALAIIAISILVFKEKRVVGKTLLKTSVFGLGLIILLSIFVYFDFNKYFTYFHEVFFSNDLWILDPKIDILIQMMPLEFFISIVTKVIAIFTLELILLFVIGLGLNRICYGSKTREIH